MQGDFLRISIITAVPVALLIAFSSAHADPVSPAGAFVESAAQDVIGIIKTPKIEQKQRVERYDSVFSRTVDGDLIARIAVGRHWRRATDDQRKEYLKLFRAHVTAIYAARFGSHPDAKVEIVNEIEASPTDTLVSAQITSPKDDEKLDTVFRVSNEEGSYRIVDVTVNGMSLVLTKRAEIDSIVVKKGFDELLAALRRNHLAEVDPQKILNGL